MSDQHGKYSQAFFDPAYTLMMWSDVEEIGCSVGVCTTSYFLNKNQVLCYVGPQGNVYGEVPYSQEIARNLNTLNYRQSDQSACKPKGEWYTRMMRGREGDFDSRAPKPWVDFIPNYKNNGNGKGERLKSILQNMPKEAGILYKNNGNGKGERLKSILQNEPKDAGILYKNNGNGKGERLKSILQNMPIPILSFIVVAPGSSGWVTAQVQPTPSWGDYYYKTETTSRNLLIASMFFVGPVLVVYKHRSDEKHGRYEQIP